MKSEVAITVKNLTIKYKNLKSYSIKRNLLSFNKSKNDFINAVDNVSFEVKKGEIVGVIGSNGSGKSTLLRSISGVFSPDEGTINLHGNSVSLSSIGVGFRSDLSGRENILLSGMLLGFSEEELLEKEDQIIEFADIGNYIDRPVKTYSSGMYSKLAFSITSNLETDILLIDEVLSVGDQKFRKKSRAKMLELIRCENKTVLFVSHNMHTISSLCDRIIWLNKGKVKMIGNTDEVIKKYEEFMD